MSRRDPEHISAVLKRVFVPYPDSWHDVHIVESDETQLDLFGNKSPCNPKVAGAYSPETVSKGER